MLNGYRAMVNTADCPKNAVSKMLVLDERSDFQITEGRWYLWPGD
jgi:hypothetical protein